MLNQQKCKSLLTILLICFSTPLLIVDNSAAPGKVGLGIVLANNGQIVVQAVLPGSPAEAAGIVVGDIVMEINGDAVEGHPVDQVAGAISGPAGTEVTLLIWHTSKRTTEKIVLKRVKDFAPVHSPPSNASLAPTGNSSGSARTASPRMATAASVMPSSGTQRFQRFEIVDTNGTGTDAYHMSIPAGWRGDGRIVWDVQRQAFPASVAIRAQSPDGSQEFDYYPFMLFAWSPLIAQATRGGPYLGAEVIPHLYE